MSEFKPFTEEPCASCKWRWPNENHPDEKVGGGCSQSGCTERPDLTYMYEPKED